LAIGTIGTGGIGGAIAAHAARGLIEAMGFAGLDLGPLAQGGKLQQVPGGVFPGRDLLLLDRAAAG
jgi:8-hydroxy-5-deazaflavin:NADPH oxidoreductase